MSDRRGDLNPPDVLAHLAALYQRGVLVPFIGSGMSRPLCTSWPIFLRRLAQFSEVEIPHTPDGSMSAESTLLYRLAETTVSALRPMSREDRNRIYRLALRCDGVATDRIPSQTEALAGVYWPLVLTTNYDDLYWSATRPTKRPVVLGREREDCHRVLRSLDESHAPILWAIQGFLAGQVASPEDVIPDQAQRHSLSDQLVVGHQQYQRAVNEDGHFRRAFAEVYRRRSLLFLGSGILEDYFVNLFGETIHQLGPGPRPHFALISADERERFDPWFLQTRLGILPVFYESHGIIPEFLRQFSDVVRTFSKYSDDSRVPCVSTARLEHIGFALGSATTRSIQVNLFNGPLPVPSGPHECSVVSVGRWENSPLVGNQAGGHLSAAREAGVIRDTSEGRWVPLDEPPSYSFRFGDAPIFAVAARRRDLKGRKHDRRDLGIIPEAICTALSRIHAIGYTCVHIGAIASGRGRPWHPIHPFAQTLRGIRKFFAENAAHCIQTVNLHVVDPGVWSPLACGQIPVAELISSDLSTHRVELRDTEGSTQSITLTLGEPPTLDQLLTHCRINRQNWTVQIVPRPTDESDASQPADDMTITSTMIVVLSPRLKTAIHPEGHSIGD